ncbi:unnamed protein product [Pseudo-nitzschia multistriata]|uniref:ABC transporter n=1 Tax=Pseudo-nitzschia multistriata TaxID=183589 RepID=A0A448Z6A6_9STRA|nr:unnamed protein product [Pseudo-nitzschia multistriata]
MGSNAAPAPAPAATPVKDSEGKTKPLQRAKPAHEKRTWPEDYDRDAPEGFALSFGRWMTRIWNNWTYSYMNVVLSKGAAINGASAKQKHNRNSNEPNTNIAEDSHDPSSSSDTDKNDDDGAVEDIHLTSDDLWPVPRKMQSTRLVNMFESNWKNASRTRTSPNATTTKRQLMKTLWKIATPTFLPAGIFQFVSTVLVSVMPLVVRRFLSILEKETTDGSSILREGLSWAILLTVMTLLNGFATQRYRHQSVKTGIALRSAVVNMVYRHVLMLSPRGKRGLTSGEINNLVAVDAQKLYEVTQEGHLIWALPLSVVLVTWFLCLVMGPSTLVGVVVLVGFLPLIKLVTKRMTEARAQRLKYSDDRVEITCSMLLGMRTTKLNGYESKYEARIKEARSKELRWLAKEQAWWATTLLMTVSSPILAMASTFATYVLTSTESEPRVLTAADTFGVLLLFGALRFPINFAGLLIGSAAQALSATRRICAFLDRPLREGGSRGEEQDPTGSLRLLESDGDKDNKDIPLILTNGRFRVGVAPEDLTESSSIVNDNETDSNVDNNSDAAAIKNITDQSTSLGENYNNNIENGNRDNLSFTVSEFNFELRRGEVMVVCGPVGSGKSTLLNGILDEAEALGPNWSESATASTYSTPMVQKNGRISYAPQDPFILNLSLRENILFGSDFDVERYNRVLDACALRPDIEQLGGSDLVQIGERGVTLSGGQRQRVSLARAAYKQPDSSCILLDDPFSALDSGTGKIVFEQLIAGPDALLRDSAVLLVTHASHFISHRAVDKVLLMVNGRNEFLGTWEELTHFNDEEHDDQTRRAVDHIQSQIRENTDGHNHESTATKEGDSSSSNLDNKNGKSSHHFQQQPEESSSINDNKIMQQELREHGLSSMKTWILWFKRAGGAWFGMTIFFFLFLDRFAYVAVEWFLASWTSGAYEPVTILGVDFDAQSDGLQAQAQYLKVFASIILVSLLATAVRSEFAVTGGVRATKNVFNSMLESVLSAPMSYFETVPMGRILNRFTYDTDVNDVTLTQKISMFIISCSWYVASIAVQVAIIPWSALALFPVSMLYLLFMHYYRLTGPDLQRIDALSRSPIQSMISECLEGSTSIRIFHQKVNFVRKFEEIVDVNSSALLNYISVQRWLSLRMEILGSVVVMIATVLLVCLNETMRLSAGLAGLLITWSANFTITLNFLVQTFSETEAAITAIERVDAMADLPSEKSRETAKEFLPPTSWPEQGLLEFKNVSLRYREGLPLALDNLSFAIPAGKTCGIVGRTGAGKSSITVALFRLVEVESGSMLLDDVDLTTLGLSDVRGRGMSIIPQDPFLAGANLRECLDPFGQRTDDEIMEALESVRMGRSSYSGVAPPSVEVVLSTKLEEGGSNYSVGERQLLNLARALLSQPKVLVLDEATASIDGETDAFIQKMLRTRFPNTTLVTIAHRLNTIMDYDYVLVMDAGKAAEFDAPAKLLGGGDGDEKGIFSQLVDATGAESSKALRQMAKESWESKNALQ